MNKCGVICRSIDCLYYKTLRELLKGDYVLEWCQTCKRCWPDKFDLAPKPISVEQIKCQVGEK